ncbi:hypothetical protein QE152_g18042 [Popillia japonica]|uniref:Uncharacterized protein n=1 Tax=Popillia japonica TaxID=7064 RepID=A0AAW1L4U7_POPJA
MKFLDFLGFGKLDLINRDCTTSSCETNSSLVATTSSMTIINTYMYNCVVFFGASGLERAVQIEMTSRIQVLGRLELYENRKSVGGAPLTQHQEVEDTYATTADVVVEDY